MQIGIESGGFTIDGRLTYSSMPGARSEAFGRLMNTRMVQATFHDENPATRDAFCYPDGASYDPDRQTAEFIDALPEYRRHGIIAVTVNCQGGYPYYHVRLSADQILQHIDNSAFTEAGALKWAHAHRLEQIIAAADGLEMIVIVGLFYFGQNHRLRNEDAVTRAVAEAVEFLAGLPHGNIMIEINNECNIGYVHPVLQPARVHELILQAHAVSHERLLVSTSFGGGTVPGDNVLATADYILLHGNDLDADNIGQMVATVRARSHKPLVFNEDSTSIANLRAAWDAGASWGYYDQGRNNYRDGFQSPPTNWSINTPEKIAFFQTVARLIGLSPDSSPGS